MADNNKDLSKTCPKQAVLNPYSDPFYDYLNTLSREELLKGLDRDIKILGDQLKGRHNPTEKASENPEDKK